MLHQMVDKLNTLEHGVRSFILAVLLAQFAPEACDRSERAEMARPLRLDFPGALHHVTARGNARQDIFFGADDRQRFLDNLGQVCERLGWICYAYCLLDNHYHLLIETPTGGLARGMRQVNGVYTQYVNRAHDRVGHLFQGRYSAILVHKDSHLLELCRYIVLNPVRAGLVGAAGEYAWSSYRATTGEVRGPKWLHSDTVLSLFGGVPRTAKARYRRFVAEGAASRPWDNLVDQVFLGPAGFVDEMKARIGDDTALGEVPRAQRRAPARSLEHYEAAMPGRNAAMLAAWQSGDHTQQAIARHFGIHYTTVSRILKRLEA
jgi:putative transposase